MSLEMEIAGERLQLFANRTIVWPHRRTLILADPHFGKAATFRAHGIPVPGDTNRKLAELSECLLNSHAERLVILGDFWHAPAGVSNSILEDLNRWRARHQQLHLLLIRGNHDYSLPPPKSWADSWQSAAQFDSPFLFSHFPQPSDHGYVLAGHLHPAVKLWGQAKQRVKLPCFWFQKNVGVLPAFGEMTGHALITPSAGDQVFAIADDHVIDLNGRCQ